MAADAGRPSLVQLRQQQQRARRGRSSQPGRGAGQRRGREEQPRAEDEPAEKRPRGEESSAPETHPRPTETLAADAAAILAPPFALQPQPHLQPQGQAPPRAPSRTPVPAGRHAVGGSDVSPPPEAWAPAFSNRGGTVLTSADSVRRDPETANVLLKGLALPVDMSALDAASIDDNFLELHSCLVKASQASIATHKKAVAMAKATKAAETKLKEERKASEQLKREIEGLGKKMGDLTLEKQTAEGRAKSAEEKVAAAEADARRAEERAKVAEDRTKEALDRAKAAEGKLAEVRSLQDDMLAAADKNGYDRGEKEAGRQYLKEAEEMEIQAFGKGYRLATKDCFPRAYLRGVDACNAPPRRRGPDRPRDPRA